LDPAFSSHNGLSGILKAMSFCVYCEDILLFHPSSCMKHRNMDDCVLIVLYAYIYNHLYLVVSWMLSWCLMYSCIPVFLMVSFGAWSRHQLNAVNALGSRHITHRPLSTKTRQTIIFLDQWYVLYCKKVTWKKILELIIIVILFWASA